MLMLLAFVSVIKFSSDHIYICIYIFAILFTWSIYQKNNINILRDLTRTAMNYEGVGQDSDGMAESDKLCF